MSLRTVQLVWNRSKRRGSALLVLLAIADYVNDDKGGVAWPGVAKLAKKTRLSERQLQRVIRSLKGSGELQVRRNAGPNGTNLYKILLAGDGYPLGDSIVTGDKFVPAGASSEATSGVAGAAQSVKEPIYYSTPTVPAGDIGFWIEKSFECFGQPRHPVPRRVLKVVEQLIPFLEKKHAPLLVRFYRREPIDSKEKPFNSRKHSPERLLLNLPAQLALAVRTCPPPPPKKEEPPRWEDFCRWKHPGCSPPKSFYELPSWVQREYESEYENFRAQIAESRVTDQAVDGDL